MFSQAGAQQGEALRQAVREGMLKALQGRELTLANVKKVLEQAADATSAAAAKSALPGVDVEALLGQAMAGMDAALLQAVQAHRMALQQFVDPGMGLQEQQMKGALAQIEKMEDAFFGALGKATEGVDGALQQPWQQALAAMKLQGSESGGQATASLAQLSTRAQAVLREGRSAGLKQARALMNGYAALASGVLIGMSDALQPSAAAPSATARARKTAR